MIPSQIVGPLGNIASIQERLIDHGRQFEHGTWLPSVGGTATYTTQNGLYQRVGGMVHLQGNLIINVLGTGSTTEISGLPFRGDSRISYAGTVAFWSGLASSYVYLSCYLDAVNNVIRFIGATTATTATTSNIAIMQDGVRVFFNVVYYKL